MFCQLNLPVDPFIEDFEIPEILYLNKKNRYYPVDKENINDQTKKIFDEIQLTIGGIIIFKKHKNGISPVHSDILLVDRQWIKWHAAINYNLTSAYSKMMWFETKLQELHPKTANLSQPLEYNLSGIHYGRWENRDMHKEDFSIIASCGLTTPTLVRTDIPHTTVNLDNKDRLCASIRFNNNYTYEQLLAKFSNYVL
jgi:hypothetical protein